MYTRLTRYVHVHVCTWRTYNMYDTCTFCPKGVSPKIQSLRERSKTRHYRAIWSIYNLQMREREICIETSRNERSYGATTHASSTCLYMHVHVLCTYMHVHVVCTCCTENSCIIFCKAMNTWAECTQICGFNCHTYTRKKLYIITHYIVLLYSYYI